MERLDLRLAHWGAVSEGKISRASPKEAIAIFLGKKRGAWEWALREETSQGVRWSKISFKPLQRRSRTLTTAPLPEKAASERSWISPRSSENSTVVDLEGSLGLLGPLRDDFKDFKARFNFQENGEDFALRYLLEIEAVEKISGKAVLWTLTPMDSFNGHYCLDSYPDIKKKDACRQRIDFYSKSKAEALEINFD